MTIRGEPGDAGSGTLGKSPASLVYLAVAAGTFVTVIILVVLGSVGIVSTVPDLPLTVIRVLGLVLLVSGFAATGMLSGSIPPRQTDQEEIAWWRANSSKAVLTWAAAEGIAVVGGVLHMLTGDLISLAGLAGGGLVLLLLNRPQRMMEG